MVGLFLARVVLVRFGSGVDCFWVLWGLWFGLRLVRPLPGLVVVYDCWCGDFGRVCRSWVFGLCVWYLAVINVFYVCVLRVGVVCEFAGCVYFVLVWFFRFSLLQIAVARLTV